MRKIIFKWLGISITVSLILVIMLSSAPGGISISPFILVFGLFVGLIGAAFHSSIYASMHGNEKQKKLSFYFNTIALLLVGWGLYTSSLCSFDIEYANKRLIKYINSKEELDYKYIVLSNFKEQSCQCEFHYNSPNKNFMIIVNEYGELNFWDESAGYNKPLKQDK